MQGFPRSNWPVGEMYWLVVDVGGTSTLWTSTSPRQVSLAYVRKLAEEAEESKLVSCLDLMS